MSIKSLENTHDLRLPAWGPYTKRYAGISHIPERETGLRFDLSVFPGFYRRKVDVPSVTWESGYHTWEAAPDLSYFANRHELEWKDQVYADISFSRIDESQRLIRCECVNNTAAPQNLVLHLMASLQCPSLRSHSTDVNRPPRPVLPEGALWLEALDYTAMSYARPRPTDSLVPDGRYRGEVRGPDFTAHSALGLGFGRDEGDRVAYRFTLAQGIPQAMLLFRYRAAQDTVLSLNNMAQMTIMFPGGADMQLQGVPVGDLEPGEHSFDLTALGGSEIEIDGIAVVGAHDAANVSFERNQWAFTPEIIPGELPNSLLLKYGDVADTYGLAWHYPIYQVREFLTDELDTTMRLTVHHHVQTVLRGQGEGHYTNIFLRPIPLQPHSRQVIYALACNGERDAAAGMVRAFAAQPEGWEATYTAARDKAARAAAGADAERYRFSQERMAATVLTNLVYPVYCKRSHIRHNSPGRWWDSLYTWDSGFVALGLLELDVQRAVDCLNAYMTEPGDEQCAFIHHGSPVPVQHYAFLELWNRTQDRELLAHFYPRLRQYHRFMAGRLGSSTTRSLPSNLLKTWDYFYNSGGWDDYPPQVAVHAQRLEPTTAPAVTTAHVIRTAKILRMAAAALGVTEDITEYDRDIETLSEALQRHAWDKASGYFGYVCHDAGGRPTGILRHESGLNFDMGLDGTSPLLAGICTPQQEQSLLERLMSPDHLWTPIGLSTVDQSAPYYRADGYWNGAVWMPHQWFYWKALLDLGKGAGAWRIARTALEVWKAEVDASYHCFEHFIVASGRGAGWHQFSGLSAPVLAWFNAYYRPGRLTCGLDTWIVEQDWAADRSRLEATLTIAGSGTCVVLATMNPAGTYHITWNGREVPCEALWPGTLQIALPRGGPAGKLVVGA